MSTVELNLSRIRQYINNTNTDSYVVSNIGVIDNTIDLEIYLTDRSWMYPEDATFIRKDVKKLLKQYFDTMSTKLKIKGDYCELKSDYINHVYIPLVDVSEIIVIQDTEKLDNDLRVQFRRDCELCGWYDFDTDTLLGTWEDAMEYAKENSLQTLIVE